MTPISVQLYSLREACETNFDQVLETLSNIGFKGVEPYNLFGKTPEAFRNQVESLGMKVSSSHHPWANRVEIAELVETLQTLGLNRAACGFSPEDFTDLDSVKRTAGTVQGLIDALAPHGIGLFLHNHWWEFTLIEGKPAYHHFQALVPDVQFELDTYWAANFGACDPAEEVARVKDRVPLIHIKDGPLEPNKANVAVGSGRMDIAATIGAADPNVLEWVIVELDACDTDMMTAVQESYEYLTNNNLVTGNV